MTIYDIIFASLVASIALAIFVHVNTGRYARAAAKRHCEQEGVQFLDQNVVLEGMGICRSRHQLFAFKRQYRFEFSSIGDHRYRGHVVMVDNRVQSIELEPYKTQPL